MTFKKISLAKRNRKKKIKKIFTTLFEKIKSLKNLKNLFKFEKKGFFHQYKQKSYLSMAVISLMVVLGAMVIYDAGKIIYQKLANFSFKDVAIDIVGSDLPTDENGLTNFLILGVGGKNHDGADLTDSMIVASIDQESSSIVMLSIPRDLYVQTEVSNGRINEILRDAPAYYKKQGYSEEKAQEMAMEILEKTVTDITGLKIHRYAKIDFQGFIKLVDAIGGVDVFVDQTIDDQTYPDTNWGYQHFYLEAGAQHLDGETALKYARSRHNSSDFDRAQRQQKTLEAIREKTLRLGILTSPEKIKELMSIIDKNFQSDLKWREIVTLAGFASNFDRSRMFSHVLNDNEYSEGGFLVTPDRSLYGGAFVLVPFLNLIPDHKYDQIKTFAKIIFENRYLSTNPPEIEIGNGTNISNLANDLKYHLNRYGIPVSRIYTAEEKVQKTIIRYKDTEKNRQTVKILQALFQAEAEVDTTDTPQIAEDTDLPSTEDKITIIIGPDYQSYRTPAEF